MSYTPKQGNSGGGGGGNINPNQMNQQAKATLAGIANMQQQMQNLVSQNPQNPSLNAFFNLQQQNLLKQQMLLQNTQFLQQLQQQQQQQQQQAQPQLQQNLAGKEPLALTRTPNAAEILNKTFQQQANGSAVGANIGNVAQFSQHLQAFAPNTANLMQHLQAYQYQMQQQQQHQNQTQHQTHQQQNKMQQQSVYGGQNTSNLHHNPQYQQTYQQQQKFPSIPGSSTVQPNLIPGSQQSLQQQQALNKNTNSTIGNQITKPPNLPAATQITPVLPSSVSQQQQSTNNSQNKNQTKPQITMTPTTVGKSGSQHLQNKTTVGPSPYMANRSIVNPYVKGSHYQNSSSLNYKSGSSKLPPPTQITAVPLTKPTIATSSPIKTSMPAVTNAASPRSGHTPPAVNIPPKSITPPVSIIPPSVTTLPPKGVTITPSKQTSVTPIPTSIPAPIPAAIVAAGATSTLTVPPPIQTPTVAPDISISSPNPQKISPPKSCGGVENISKTAENPSTDNSQNTSIDKMEPDEPKTEIVKENNAVNIDEKKVEIENKNVGSNEAENKVEETKPTEVTKPSEVFETKSDEEKETYSEFKKEDNLKKEDRKEESSESEKETAVVEEEEKLNDISTEQGNNESIIENHSAETKLENEIVKISTDIVKVTNDNEIISEKNKLIDTPDTNKIEVQNAEESTQQLNSQIIVKDSSKETGIKETENEVNIQTSNDKNVENLNEIKNDKVEDHSDIKKTMTSTEECTFNNEKIVTEDDDKKEEKSSETINVESKIDEQVEPKNEQSEKALITTNQKSNLESSSTLNKVESNTTKRENKKRCTQTTIPRDTASRPKTAKLNDTISEKDKKAVNDQSSNKTIEKSSLATVVQSEADLKEDVTPQDTSMSTVAETSIVTDNKSTLETPQTPKDESGRSRSKRHRLKTILYQSPLPELAFITKLSASEASNSPKPGSSSNEDKLVVFYKNEYLAVRNSENGFFLCQTLHNVYKTSPRIRIRWLSEEKTDSNVYIPDFYDTTDIECVLTTVNLSKVSRDRFNLPEQEKERIESILKKAIDVEKGIVPRPDITEENPDGLDISLYTDESQIEKKRLDNKSPRRTSSSKKTTTSLSSKKKLKSKSASKSKNKRKRSSNNVVNTEDDEEDDDEDDIDEPENDKEYRPSHKKRIVAQSQQSVKRLQRSPLARARAASPITLKKQQNQTYKTVPQKSSNISTPSSSSRESRAAKRRRTDSDNSENLFDQRNFDNSKGLSLKKGSTKSTNNRSAGKTQSNFSTPSGRSTRSRK